MTVRRAIIGSLIAITLLVFPLQVMIEPTLINTATVCIATASSLVMLFYIAWSQAIHTHPLSTFTLFGFCVTTQLGALLVQTTAWTAVSAYLYDPLDTFGLLAFFQAIALSVHVTYRFFSVPRRASGGPLRRLFGWMGIYKVPPPGALWFMGLIGLTTFFFSRHEGVIGKIATGFVFLAWAPLLIPLYLQQCGDGYGNARINKGFLVGYVMVAVALGLALNTRAVMFSGVATIVALYLLVGMRSTAPVTSRALGRLLLLAVVLLAVARPVSDLATAMAVARQWRGKVAAVEMVKTTFFVLGKPNLIAAYRAQGEVASRFGAYDERYVVNPLLNRLVATKYYDNAFHFAKTLGSADAKARLADVSMQFAWAGLPTPMLDRLGIPVVKEELGYSMGDYLAYLSRGVPLGGHRIGSMLAQGLALFGPVFPFIDALICLLLFALMDLLSVRSVTGEATLGTLGMLQIWTFFLSGISYEGLHLVLYWIFRNFEQMLLIYVLVFGVTRMVAAILRPATPVAAHPTLQQS